MVPPRSGTAVMASVLNAAPGGLRVSILLGSFSGALCCSFVWDALLRLPVLAAASCLALHVRQGCYVARS